MRVLVDTNVILDYVLERQPFHTEAEEIIMRVARQDFIGYVSSITPIKRLLHGQKTQRQRPHRQSRAKTAAVI
jgi:predicted nucleic acid-binding protein